MSRWVEPQKKTKDSIPVGLKYDADDFAPAFVIGFVCGTFTGIILTYIWLAIHHV